MSDSDGIPGLDPDALLKMQGAAGTVAAAITGMKQQFVDQGWSEENAEAMVVEMFRMNNNQQAQAASSGNRAQRRAAGR